MFIEHLDGPLSQAGTVETFIQVEESCRGEDVSEYPAIGEIRGAGCTLVIQMGMGPPQYVLTVCTAQAPPALRRHPPYTTCSSQLCGVYRSSGHTLFFCAGQSMLA